MSNTNLGGVLDAFNLLAVLVLILIGVGVIDRLNKTLLNSFSGKLKDIFHTYHFFGGNSSESVNHSLEWVSSGRIRVDVDIEVIVASSEEVVVEVGHY